jgi:nicotinate-nucleotide adenylyltransferase
VSAPATRIGLFGGAFDPPHNAHVALAEAAVQQLGLHTLFVLPTGQPWHRKAVPSAAEHRVAMARLAFADVPQVVVDARETRRSGPTFTADTLAELRAEHPQAKWHLLIGADQAKAFTQWQRWQELAANAIICIAQRDHLTLTTELFSSEMGSEVRFETLQTPLWPVSATDIRQRVAAGLGVSHLVSEPVARYIAFHQLYQTPR